MYARSIDALNDLWLPPDPEAEKKYYDGKDEHLAEKGPYRLKPLEATKSMGRRENLIYPITAPDGTEVLPKRQWWWARLRTEKVQADNGLVFTKREEGWSVSYKQYLIGADGKERGAKPFSVIDGIYTQHGTADIRALFDDEVVFSFPKPVALLSRLVEFGSENDSIIMDFFAGSGTTGHAVMAKNASDGGSRRYVLVQLPELLDPNNKDQEVAADYCDKIHKARNLAELTKERLRRASKMVKDQNPMFAGDLGFRVFKLASSNIRAWEPNRDDLPKTLEESIDHLKTDRTEQDILFELLLKLGLDLTVAIEQKTIAGKAVHNIGAGTLLVCLAEKIAAAEVEPLALGIVAWHKELDPAGETSVVFRDSAFADDVAKTNLTAILQQHGLENVRSL
jgi:adenine-specific DNA-methyltransferase